MLSHFSGVVGEKEEEAKRSRSLLMRSEEELASLRDSMEAKTRQEGQILRKIETLEQRLTQDNDRLVQLNSSLQQQSDRIAAERDSLDEEKMRLRA
jgi:septal ring factor EnvC (AmiA/AmiB activator)